MRVFLSSPFRARDTDADKLFSFRKELKYDAAKVGIDIVLAESPIRKFTKHYRAFVA